LIDFVFVLFQVRLGLLRGSNGGTVFKAIAIKGHVDQIQIELNDNNNHKNKDKDNNNNNNNNNNNHNNNQDNINFYTNTGRYPKIVIP
jgi:hypothetical protein